MTNDDKAWFEPKSRGYGAGMPIAWQGWAVLGLYLLVMIGAAFFVSLNWLAFIAISVLATVALLVICSQKTRGGWRWRWGGD